MRQRWVKNIGAAIDGFEHSPPHADFCIAANYAETEAVIADKFTYAQPDLPKKKGKLDKKSLGDILGYRFTSTRWFKLEGGELSYYDDESMSPASLRRVLPLVGAKLVTGSDDHSPYILVRLRDGQLLEMTTPVMKEAHEWKEALSATISGLRMYGSRTTFKNRRTNAFDTNDVAADDAGNDVDNDDRAAIVKKPKKDRPRLHDPYLDALSKKDEETVRAIRGVLKLHFCFRHISDIDPIIHAMKPRTCLPGEVVIWQGGPGNMFFYLQVIDYI